MSRPDNIYRLPVATDHGTTYIELEFAPQVKGFPWPSTSSGTLHTPQGSSFEGLAQYRGELFLDPTGDCVRPGHGGSRQ